MQSPAISSCFPWCCLLVSYSRNHVISHRHDQPHLNGFDGEDMSLSGIAEVDGRLIKLTHDSPQVFGHTLYTYPVRMKTKASNMLSSFSSTFVFCITPLLPSVGGHSLSFVMFPLLNLQGIFSSQYLGMLNMSNNGNTSNHVFGVEFDTVQVLNCMDINDNYVGINLNSITSTNSSTTEYWPSATVAFSLNYASQQSK